MYTVWMQLKHASTDANYSPIEQTPVHPPTASTPLISAREKRYRWWHSDLVDTKTVDLMSDEYQESGIEQMDSGERESHVEAQTGWLSKIYYWLA
jgi:hypothetical protein